MTDELKLEVLVKGETVELSPFMGYDDKPYTIRASKDGEGYDVRTVTEDGETQQIELRDIDESEAKMITDYFEKYERNLNTNRIEPDILFDVAQNLGYEDDEDFMENEDMVNRINRMSPEQLFRRYCEWNGLIGWSDTLKTVMMQIFNLEEKAIE